MDCSSGEKEVLNISFVDPLVADATRGYAILRGYTAVASVDIRIPHCEFCGASYRYSKPAV